MPSCSYVKADGVQCHAAALHGEELCYQHLRRRRIRWWVRREWRTILGVFLGVAGVLVTVVLAYRPPQMLTLPRVAKAEAPRDSAQPKVAERPVVIEPSVIEYLNEPSAKKKAAKDELLWFALDSVEHRVDLVGVREGKDAFIVGRLFEPELGRRLTIFRARGEESPVISEFSFSLDDAYFEKLSPYAEEAIVAWESEGSGAFLTIHVLLWRGSEYVDISKDVPDGLAYGAFQFVDVDTDSWKEMVVYQGYPAHDMGYHVFQLDRSEWQYKQVDSDSDLAKRVELMAEEDMRLPPERRKLDDKHLVPGLREKLP